MLMTPVLEFDNVRIVTENKYVSNLEGNEWIFKMQRMLALSLQRSRPCHDHIVGVYESPIMAFYPNRLDDHARIQRAPLRL